MDFKLPRRVSRGLTLTVYALLPVLFMSSSTLMVAIGAGFTRNSVPGGIFALLLGATVVFLLLRLLFSRGQISLEIPDYEYYRAALNEELGLRTADTAGFEAMIRELWKRDSVAGIYAKIDGKFEELQLSSEDWLLAKPEEISLSLRALRENVEIPRPLGVVYFNAHPQSEDSGIRLNPHRFPHANVARPGTVMS